jgi:hypothetical protein
MPPGIDSQPELLGLYIRQRRSPLLAKTLSSFLTPNIRPATSADTMTSESQLLSSLRRTVSLGLLYYPTVHKESGKIDRMKLTNISIDQHYITYYPCQCSISQFESEMSSAIESGSFGKSVERWEITVERRHDEACSTQVILMGPLRSKEIHPRV